MSTRPPAPIFKNLALDTIEVLPQVRTHFAEQSLREMAESIQQQGIIQPIVVRPAYEDALVDGEVQRVLVEGRYLLVVGERRYTACGLADVLKIPAIIRHLTDEEAEEMQLSENIHREELTAMEEAIYYQNLIEKKALVPLELAARLAKSLDYVQRRLRLNDLTSEGKELVADEVMPLAVAEVVASLTAADQQKVYRFAILEEYGPGDEEQQRPVKRYCKPLTAIRWFLQTNVLMRLDTAPWDKTKKIEGVNAPPCQLCPQRTGANTTLFNDLLENERCLNQRCFNSKLHAHFHLLAESLSQLQGQVVPFVRAEAQAIVPRGALELYGIRLITRPDEDPCPNPVSVCLLFVAAPPRVETACTDRSCACRSLAPPAPPLVSQAVTYAPRQWVQALEQVETSTATTRRRQLLLEKVEQEAIPLAGPAGGLRAMALLLAASCSQALVANIFEQAGHRLWNDEANREQTFPLPPAIFQAQVGQRLMSLSPAEAQGLLWLLFMNRVSQGPEACLDLLLEDEATRASPTGQRWSMREKWSTAVEEQAQAEAQQQRSAIEALPEVQAAADGLVQLSGHVATMYGLPTPTQLN